MLVTPCAWSMAELSRVPSLYLMSSSTPGGMGRSRVRSTYSGRYRL